MEIMAVDTTPEETPVTIKAPVFMLMGRKPDAGARLIM